MEEQYGKEKGEEVFYASANKGTITGVHDMPETREEDCADMAEPSGDQSPHELSPEHPQLQALAAQEATEPWHRGDQAPEPPLVMPPDPSPAEQGLEHPQLHPDASTPPSSADQPARRSTYGSVTGGINPFGVFGQPNVQVWGDRSDQAMQASPRAELANPSLTISEIQRQNEQFWRPHGVAPRDRGKR